SPTRARWRPCDGQYRTDRSPATVAGAAGDRTRDQAITRRSRPRAVQRVQRAVRLPVVSVASAVLSCGCTSPGCLPRSPPSEGGRPKLAEGGTMSDSPQGDGWWQASDGRWYPPSQASPTPGLAHSAFSPPSSSAARRTSGGGSTVNPKRRRAWLGPVIGVAAGLAVGIPLGAAISGGEPTSEGSVRSDTEIVSAEGATSVTQPPASRAPATTR